MRVCYFGTYEFDYPRNRHVIEGLRQNGVQVEEIHFNQWDRGPDKLGVLKSLSSWCLALPRLIYGSISLFFRLWSAWNRLDILCIGYIGQLDVLIAHVVRCLRGHRPLVFNPLISLHDTLIGDRQMFGQGSLAAKMLLWLDRLSMRLSDVVLIDTDAHARYFAEHLRVPEHKLRVVPVGAEDLFFLKTEEPPPHTGVRVLFVGKLIPLHGIEFILEAAKLLEQESDVSFEIVGRGQLEERVHELSKVYGLSRITFTRWVPYAALPQKLAEADMCLGIFGDSGKARRVVPNKVFQAMAAGKAVITGDSDASRELLSHRETAYLCQMGSGEALAQAILELVRDEGLRQLIAQNGRALAEERFTPTQLGKELKGILLQTLEGNR
jgi:glycosyltransferase involved in cell wall biosynthesis